MIARFVAIALVGCTAFLACAPPAKVVDARTLEARTTDAKAATSELGDLLWSIEEDSCKTEAPDPGKACAAERFLPFVIRYQRRWEDDVDPVEDSGIPSALPRHGGHHRSPEDVAERESALCQARCTRYENERWKPEVEEVVLACDGARDGQPGAKPIRESCSAIASLRSIPPLVDRVPLLESCVTTCDQYRKDVAEIEAFERRPHPKNEGEKAACWKECAPLVCPLRVDCRCFELCQVDARP